MGNTTLRLCTSENVFILPLHLFDNWAGYRTLGWKSFPFRNLNTLPHLLFVSRDAIEKYKAILIFDSLYITFSFSGNLVDYFPHFLKNFSEVP